MDEIFKISKDMRRANTLFEMAKERLEDIIPLFPKDKTYKLIEEYYEVIVQLITGIMYSNGYKTLNHISLIKYLSDNYKDFSHLEIKLADDLRKFRHGAVYYGKKIEKEFWINNEGAVKVIIDKLLKILEKEMKRR